MSALRGIAAMIVCVLLSAGSARADAKFVLMPRGEGFTDRTPVAPVGGNPGKTLGEQRRLVIERALEIWSKKLDSKVPILVQATFSKLDCDQNGAVVGQAVATDWLAFPSGDRSSPPVFYPGALADRLAERDLIPGKPDILIDFNGSLDVPPCSHRLGGPMYYGLDGAGRGGKDVLSIVLHELAHGLGFASQVDVETGASDLRAGFDSFTAHIRDLDLDRPWTELSDAQRARSATNVRRIVFDGPETTRATQRFLATGAPSLTISPQVPGFSGWVADVDIAVNPARAPVSGKVVLGDPVNGCDELQPSAAGAVVMLEFQPGRCALRDALLAAERAGAVGVLLLGPSLVELPALPGSVGGSDRVGLPVVTLSARDAVAIVRASARQEITATLGGAADQRQGADPRGRPLLFASQPVAPGSSISHFEPLARPDPLMEPYTTERAQHDLDLTVAVLRDVGWTPFCGNGVIDPGEDCDEGAANVDSLDARCRTTCRRPHCGDGVRDPGETCDDGDFNSALRPDACRPDCAPARCGDGVVDEGEECDGKDGCSPECRLRIDPWTPSDELDQDDGGCSVGARSSGGESVLWTSFVAVALVLGGRRVGRRGRVRR